MGIQQIQDTRVRQLAQTLRSNGLAASDSEAVRMAESMTNTESKVTRHFDENKSSMVRNFDVSKAESAPQPAAPIQDTPREKEDSVQQSPQRIQGSAPTQGNQAITQAIANVKQQFQNEAPAVPLSQATEQELKQENTQAAAPEQAPAQEQATMQEAPANNWNQEQSVVENPLPAQETTPIQQAAQEAPAPVAAQQEVEKDVSKYAEAKVDLADVFNFNK